MRNSNGVNGVSPLVLSRTQRSHVLFVLSGATPESEARYREWYGGVCRQQIGRMKSILSARHYEKHEVDITHGQYMTLPFRYLALYELSLDGAEAANGIIEAITGLHREQPGVAAPATWLYYPATEKVGRSPQDEEALLTVAFANGVAGQEDAFREWYGTRHIRHALQIPELVSGQTYERTRFQRPGALEAMFATIAVYETVGTPESLLESVAALPKGALDFPTLDLSRFSEAVFRTI